MQARLMRWARENRGFVAFLLALLLVRGAVADWNPIPSGSMHPTLLEGDVVLVNRLAYDLKLPFTTITLLHLGDPRRGDIVTFWSPADHGRRLIKRIIGLPGDIIAMHDKRLVINGRPAVYRSEDSAVERIVSDENGEILQLEALHLREDTGSEQHRIEWLRGTTRAQDFGPVRIPPGRYLMLGDNRDNSADSRYIGLVPRELLIGRAVRILVSDDYQGNWAPRFRRFGQGLYPAAG